MRWPCDENFRTLEVVIHEVIAPEDATKSLIKFGMVAARRLNQNRANVERPAKSVEWAAVAELNLKVGFIRRAGIAPLPNLIDITEFGAAGARCINQP